MSAGLRRRALRAAVRKHPASRTAIWWAHSLLVNQPALYLPISRWRWRNVPGIPDDPGDTRPVPLRKSTAIVIEGQPRSANTFAVIAFRLAQRQPVEIAHHLHSASQVLEGVRRSLPTLVLVREPEEAIMSRVISHPPITPAQALIDYVRFHRAILNVRHGYVVAPFDQVTSNFGKVIEGINERFQTTFDLFQHTEENVQRCFTLIDGRFERQGRAVPQRLVAHPSTERRQLKDMMRTQLKRSHGEGLRLAEELYGFLTSG